MDLKFPHHECEIAQAVGANGKDPVHYWLHSNMLTVNGQKMSKSLGNSFLPRELFAGTHQLLDKGYSPMTVRFFMLQSHYSSTLDFSNEAMQSAEKGFKKLAQALAYIKKVEVPKASVASELTAEMNRMAADCYTSMSDDFNSAKVIAVLFEMSARINDMKSGNLTMDKVDATAFVNFQATYIAMMEDVLGLKEETEAGGSHLEGVINVLIELRKKARTDRNYALSDKIRDDLQAIGVQLKDGKNGEMTYAIE